MKVITETALRKGESKPPQDRLGHDKITGQIFQSMSMLPAGAVIALQGAWGRGKSDLLWRLAYKTYHETDKLPAFILPEAIWINPWRYGNPDLLTPLVRALVKRLQHSTALTPSSLKDKLLAVGSLLRAGLAFGVKSVVPYIPGDLLAEGDKFVLELLNSLFEAKSEEMKGAIRDSVENANAEGDPVENMGDRFAELVATLVPDPKQRLMICVDDLDRCMPTRQVAMLEAMHFLTATDARVVFVVAIDPTLAEKSILTHFQSDNFDPKTFLSKIFSYRYNLPAVGENVSSLMEQFLKDLDREADITAAFHVTSRNIIEEVERSLSQQDVRNPRTLERVAIRLGLFATQLNNNNIPCPTPANNIGLLLKWLALCERWPELRHHLQGCVDAKNFREVLSDIREYYRSGNTNLPSLRSLPPPGENPAIGPFLESMQNADAEAYYDLERKLQRVHL